MQSDLREPTDPSAPNQPATNEKLDQLISEVARLRKSVKKLTAAEKGRDTSPFNDPEFLNECAEFLKEGVVFACQLRNVWLYIALFTLLTAIFSFGTLGIAVFSLWHFW